MKEKNEAKRESKKKGQIWASPRGGELRES
jgi:hypothetical protein